MGIATMLLVYVIIWWMIFFMALPFGVKNIDEDGDDGRAPGSDLGAPVKGNLVKKAIITSVIALVLTFVFVQIEQSDLVNFRQEARQASQ